MTRIRRSPILRYMTRCLLTFVLAVSIALAGYAPSFAMQPTVEKSSAVQAAADADADCMKAKEDDCCDKQGSSDKAKCLFDDACAARCHVSAAIAPAFFSPGVRISPAGVIAVAEPPPLHAARAGPLYRPPIV